LTGVSRQWTGDNELILTRDDRGKRKGDKKQVEGTLLEFELASSTEEEQVIS